MRRIVGDEAQPLPTPVQHYFNSKKYDAPTPIQAQSLPLTLRGRDVVAVAQTGASDLSDAHCGRLALSPALKIYPLASAPRSALARTRPQGLTLFCSSIMCCISGSGKTVGFLLPLLWNAAAKRKLDRNTRGPLGFILAPTRELAQQVRLCLLP